MPDLEVSTAEARHVFSDAEVVTIGRREDNRVIVLDPTVSRQHAVIRYEGGRWTLEDLTGGRTFFNGQPVSRLVLTPGMQRINLASLTGPWVAVSVEQQVQTETLGTVAEAPPATVAMQAPQSATAGTVPLAVAAQPATPSVDTPGAAASPPPMASPGAPGPPPGPQQWAPARPGLPPQGSAAGAGRPPTAPNPFGNVELSNLKKALNILFPYRAWIENAGWRSGNRVFFLLYAMLPVIFDVVFWNTTNFQTLGWVYALYTAPLWLVVFWVLIKPEDSKWTLLIYGGVISFVVLLFMAGPLQWWYNTVPNPERHAGNWFAWLLGPGLAEEATKDGAVLLTLIGLRYYFKEHLSVRGTMFLGTVAGLAFGAREAALYQDNDLNLFNVSGPHALVQYVLLFSLRIFTDGLQHAEWAGIACFFIGLGLKYQRRRLPLILFGFGFGAILHATNDWATGESHLLWLIVQILSAVLFLGYTLFATTIEAQVSESSLFRGDSIMMQQVVVDASGKPVYPQQPQLGNADWQATPPVPEAAESSSGPSAGRPGEAASGGPPPPGGSVPPGPAGTGTHRPEPA